MFWPAIWITLSLMMQVASAGSYYLESLPFRHKTEVQKLSRKVARSEYDARVLRRYRHGVGWEFVVVFEGFDGQPAASKAAKELSTLTGQGFSVFSLSGNVASLVAEQDPRGQKQDPLQLKASTEDERFGREDEQAKSLLQQAIRSHGGPEGGLAVLHEANSVLFSFKRKTADGGVIGHTFARDGDSVFLEVDVEAGEGISSRAGARGVEAWLAVEEQGPTRQDARKVRALIDRFSPETVLSFPLGFPRAAQEGGELSMLYFDGTETVDGASMRVLRYGGDQRRSPVSIALDSHDYLVRRVELDGDAGKVVHEYYDYRKVISGLVLPYRVRVLRNDVVVDEFEIVNFTVNRKLPEKWFRVRVTERSSDAP